MRKYIFQELVCSIILGSIPCSLVLLNSDAETLFSFIKSITPPEVITYYFLCLVGAHSIIWGIRYYFLQKSHLTNKVMLKLHKISEQVGFSLLGLYRAIAGSIFVSLPPVLVAEPTMDNLLRISFGYFFGGACIFVCCLLRYWNSKTAV